MCKALGYDVEDIKKAYGANDGECSRLFYLQVGFFMFLYLLFFIDLEFFIIRNDS